jgi:hypothetical protein
VPYYDDLAIIIGNEEATGAKAVTGNEANSEMPSLEEMGK